MKETITSEVMVKVWKLHNKSVEQLLIAQTMNIAPSSVCRIIKFMTAARNGDDVDSIDPGKYVKQKEYAKQFFGIEEKKKEAPVKKND